MFFSNFIEIDQTIFQKEPIGIDMSSTTEIFCKTKKVKPEKIIFKIEKNPYVANRKKIFQKRETRKNERISRSTFENKLNISQSMKDKSSRFERCIGKKIDLSKKNKMSNYPPSFYYQSFSKTKKIEKERNRKYQVVKSLIISKLVSQIGKPYRWGGKSPKTGFDCSGLIYYAYKDFVKIKIPRTSYEMFHSRNSIPIEKNKLEVGDLVFFRIHNHKEVDHVGVYLGNGRFIQSPRTGKEIHISLFDEQYWKKHYVGARRLITPFNIK